MTNYPLWDQLQQLKTAEWVDLTHTFDPTFHDLVNLKRPSIHIIYSQRTWLLCTTLEYRYTIRHTH